MEWTCNHGASASVYLSVGGRTRAVSGARASPPEHAEDPLTEDDQLVARARKGDEAAFERLVEKYARRVFDTAARFFRQPEAVEDIAQEVFLKVFQSLDAFQPGKSMEAWLFTITVNTCYDHLRRMKRRREWKFSELTPEEATWLDQHRLAEAVGAFERERERDIAAGLAEKVLDTLSPEDRMALLLYERDGFSTAEIARMMGWSRANVKVRLFRARRALRQTLERLLDATHVENEEGTS